MARRGRPRIPEITPDIGALETKLPPKPIDYDAVFHWMDLGATQEEIAGSFRVSVSTLYRRLVEKFGMNFDELKEKVCGSSKIILRQNQFNLSKTNATMAIWLGKNWLGQKDDPKGNDTVSPVIIDFLKTVREKCEQEKKK